MDLLLSDAERQFRQQVRDFLEAGRVDRDPWLIFRGRGPVAQELYRELGARGWLTQSWPREFGGEDNRVHDFIVWDELAYARAARLDLGSTVVGKTLISHGTAEQRERFLEDIRTARISFSLGYSEPEAGSDLGGLQTRAALEGDSYVVNGEKRWTSDAHHSDYLWLLARTGRLEDRSRALTFFIVDLKSRGITMNPIPLLDGHHVNEVRFENVRVPAENRIGPENAAWPIMRQALAHERHLQALPGRVRRDYEELVSWARSSEAGADPEVQRRLTDFWIRLKEIEAISVALLSSEPGSDWEAQAAASKLIGTTLLQQIARTPSDLGYQGAFEAGSPFEFLWRESLVETVGGGTIEIMRTITARQNLGLSSTS